MDNEVLTAPETTEKTTVDLKDVIKQPTEYKAPTGFNVKHIEFKESDFVDAPYVPDESVKTTGPAATNTNVNTSTQPQNTTSQPGQIVTTQPDAKIFDPDFTTDICVDMFDTAQHTTFLALNTRKQKKKRFKDGSEYDEAIRLSYLSPAELEKQEEADAKKLLIDKLKTYQSTIKDINKRLTLSTEERKKLRKPIFELVKQNNFDIPPGLALVLISMDIISTRVVDLIID